MKYSAVKIAMVLYLRCKLDENRKFTRKTVIVAGAHLGAPEPKKEIFMGKNENDKKINNSDKKQRVVVWLSPEAIERAEKLIKLMGKKNMSKTIEQALLFYAGYVMTNENTDFLACNISDALHASLTLTESRISRILFKQAVELPKLVYMLASLNELDDETLQRLHIHSVNEVKRTNGSIKLEDSIKYHREN